MRTERGKVVSVRYTLTDDEGVVLDSNESGPSLAYLHGYGNIVPGLERALEGAQPGFKSRVVVSADDGYGEHDPEAVFEITRSEFPEGMELQPGMHLGADGPEGPMRVTVLEVSQEGAVLDSNHPLAGKVLHFDVEVTEVRDAYEEEIEHGHAHA